MPTWWCWRPTRSSSSTSRTLAHKNPVSAYAGRRLSGIVRRTWLRGEPVETDARPRAVPEERTAMSTYYAPRGVCRRRPD